MSDRFRQALRAFGVPDRLPLGVAVSGGPDSLAMLLLAIEARPGRVRAATVDHQLRPEARHEAEQVAAICAERDIPHDILTVQVEGNVQAGARTARYAALEGWCTDHGLAWLATAHHADDQAETLLMRLARGSGLSGLAGIRRTRSLGSSVTLIRPLLDWRKAELEAVVEAAGLEPVRDPGNTDPRYDRSRMRAFLAEARWLDPARIAATAGYLAEAAAALEWAAGAAAAARLDGNSLDPHGLPPELLRRLMLRLFAGHGEAPRGPELDRLIQSLQRGRAATLGRLKVTPGERWTVSPAPPRRADQ